MKKYGFLLLPLLLITACAGEESSSVSSQETTTSQEDTSIVSESSTSVVETITSINEAHKQEKAIYLDINARVTAIAAQTIIIYDGTGSMLVYVGNNHSFKVDDLYHFAGNTILHDGHQQLSAYEGDLVYEKYTGEVPEFDYTPTELTKLEGLADKVGQIVKIRGLVAYKNGSYYNANKIPYDGFFTTSMVGQASYLAPIEEATEKAPMAVDMVGIFYAINYATNTGYASRYNFMLTEPLADTTLALTDLSISDSMKDFYTTENVFDTDSYLEVNATYENEATHVVNKAKYSVEVYKDNVKVDTSLKFAETGTYTVKVTYMETVKELEITVNSADTITVMRDPATLAEMNNWEDNKSSTSKTGKMDDNVSLQAFGSNSGNYSSKNNSWTIFQKASGGYDGGLLISINESYVLKGIKIVYGLNDGDSVPARLGQMLFDDDSVLASDTYASLADLSSLNLRVVNVQEDVANAFVRIKSILIQYAAK